MSASLVRPACRYRVRRLMHDSRGVKNGSAYAVLSRRQVAWRDGWAEADRGGVEWAADGLARPCGRELPRSPTRWR